LGPQASPGSRKICVSGNDAMLLRDAAGRWIGRGAVRGTGASYLRAHFE